MVARNQGGVDPGVLPVMTSPKLKTKAAFTLVVRISPAVKAIRPPSTECFMRITTALLSSDFLIATLTAAEATRNWNHVYAAGGRVDAQLGQSALRQRRK